MRAQSWPQLWRSPSRCSHSGRRPRVGQQIVFSGSASDAEDGPLPASALRWNLTIQHCPSNCHAHSVQSWDGVATGSFSAPDHEYPSHLELALTATDSGGRQETKTVRLDPRTVNLTLASEPSPRFLTLNGFTAKAPFTKTVIEGSRNTISAPSPRTAGPKVWVWVSWSDGGARTHDITANSSATYTARFIRRR